MCYNILLYKVTFKSKTLQERAQRCEYKMEKAFSFGPNVLFEL